MRYRSSHSSPVARSTGAAFMPEPPMSMPNLIKPALPRRHVRHGTKRRSAPVARVRRSNGSASASARSATRITRPAAPGVDESTRLPITCSVIVAIVGADRDPQPGAHQPRVADQEREPATGPQEPVEAVADLDVVARRCRVGVGEEQVGGEHARLEAVVDALAVHRVDQAGGVADGDPARAVAPARRSSAAATRAAARGTSPSSHDSSTCDR